MSLSVGDNTTVIGDNGTLRKDRDDFVNMKEFHPVASASSTQSKPNFGSDFVTAVDHAAEGRPFYIPIDKNGLIAALEKLDRQLIEVPRRASFVQC